MVRNDVPALATSALLVLQGLSSATSFATPAGLVDRLPAPAVVLPSVFTRGAATAGPHQCTVKEVPLSLFCNITATICSSDGETWTANVTATGNLTAVVARVGAGQSFPGQTGAQDAEADAIYRVLAGMGPAAGGSGSQPCSCQVLPATFENGGNCTVAQRVCVYYASGEAVIAGKALYRAKAFRAATPGDVGQSPGFTTPGDGTADVTVALTAAVADYSARVPAWRGECPAFPIVMMPGYPSTSLKYKLKNSPPPPGHPLCRRNTKPVNDGWQTLYPPAAADFFDLKCYFSELALDFDANTTSFHSPRQGEESAVCCGGGFPSFPSFNGVVSFFESGGWTVGKNLFGMPYDWRYPGSNSDGLPFLKELIQNASAANGGQRVVLWAVSGGPQWALSFLHRQPQAWKDRYIAYFVAQSPLWSGVAANVPAIVSGISVPQAGGTLPAPFLQGFSRAVPSVLWLLPRAGTNASTAWTQADPIIITPSKNYTAFDFDALFADVGGLSELVPSRRYLAAEPDLGELAAPGVNTFVAYGFGLDTVVGAAYAQDFTPNAKLAPPSLIVGSGDNTVPLRSSLRAEAWGGDAGMQGKRLIYKGYSGMPHAQCWPATSDDPAPCFRDVMNALRAEGV